MFGMLGRMAGLAGLAVANPATIIIGLFMGRKALRDEKERQLTVRRNQARQALRKYTDEVGFVVGKDSRDTLRRVQRQLRDHYAARAEELHRSTGEALAAAQQAARSDAEHPPEAAARRRRRAEAHRGAARQGIGARARPEVQPPGGGRQGRGGRRQGRVVNGRQHTPVLDGVRTLLEQATQIYAGTPAARARLQAVLDRLDEPLRVAIAGKVKAGKSTLLNALVGERAGADRRRRVHRIVTWYRDGITYRVTLEPDGGRAPPGPVHPRRRRHRRRPRRTDAERGRPRLVIEWPSSSLRQMTLIDTPGIGVALGRRVAPHHGVPAPRATTRSPRPTPCST